MNFKNCTVDDLLKEIPLHENDKWEFKNSMWIKDKDFKKIEKQVSAFANSKGGYIVIGLSDNRIPEPCNETVNRQPMQDYLSNIVRCCVEPSFTNFKIHRIPFSDNIEKSIFVIEIEDSLSTPYQAKDSCIYYHRVNAQSMPAPHSYIELLRDRTSRVILNIKNIDCHIGSINNDILQITFKIDILNTSLQSATHWGVSIQQINESNWNAPNNTIHGKSVLLPEEKSRLCFELTKKLNGKNTEEIVKHLKNISLSIKPISNNYSGDYSYFKINDLNKFYLQLKEYGIQ